MKASKLFKTLSPLAATGIICFGVAAHAHEKVHRIATPARSAHAPRAMAQFMANQPHNLVALQANMAQAYPVIGVNADGSDLWPCRGNYFADGGVDTDCATLGSPAMPMPNGGNVAGVPEYTFVLQNNDIIGYGLDNGYGCDALTNGTTGSDASQYFPCGQITTMFEDDTYDTTDDLLFRAVVTQGGKVIFDSGLNDFGPGGPDVPFPVDTGFYLDANFGYWPGSQAGPNNGNCSASDGYPLTSPTFPSGSYYVVADNATCVEPVAGLASVRTWTAYGTPRYTQVTGAACTGKGVASPCYTVQWTITHEIKQDYNFVLE